MIKRTSATEPAASVLNSGRRQSNIQQANIQHNIQHDIQQDNIQQDNIQETRLA